MNLPIDGRHAPIKDKYLDEETPMLARWTIFGQDPQDLTYYVEGAGDVVFKGLTFQQAEQLCLARGMFVDECLRIINRREPS